MNEDKPRIGADREVLLAVIDAGTSDVLRSAGEADEDLRAELDLAFFWMVPPAPPQLQTETGSIVPGVAPDVISRHPEFGLAKDTLAADPQAAMVGLRRGVEAETENEARRRSREAEFSGAHLCASPADSQAGE